MDTGFKQFLHGNINQGKTFLINTGFGFVSLIQGFRGRYRKKQHPELERDVRSLRINVLRTGICDERHANRAFDVLFREDRESENQLLSVWSEAQN